MNYLAIDTSRGSLTCIVSYNGKIYSKFISDCNLQHSVTLMPLIDEILQENDIALDDIDVYSAVVGAGSFTGIRIGVSTIKALAYSKGKKVLSVTSFDTLAYNVKEDKILCLIDAKHDHVYCCGYENKKVVIEPCYITISEAKKLSAGFLVVSEEEISGIESQKADILDGLIKAVESKINDSTKDIESLVPIYIRKSQAEENRQ